MKRFAIILVISINIFAGCGAATTHSFTNSVTASEHTEISEEVTRYYSIDDQSFCKTRNADECFTFVLQIPSPELEQNLSLNALALALNAEKYRVPALRACSRGIDAYAKGYQNHSATLRAKLFSPIKETRCIIDMVRRETYKLPQLVQGHIGMAFRLASWDVIGNEVESKVPPLTLTVHSASLNASYRNAVIFSRAAGEGESQWHDLFAKEFRPLGGLRPLDTRMVFTKFQKQFLARFSTVDSVKMLGDAINEIRTRKIDNESLSRFFIEAMRTIETLRNGDIPKASLTVIALAIDAIKAIRPDELMQPSLISYKLVESMNRTFGSADVIDSSSNALFSDSHLILPSRLIDDAFTNAHVGQLMKALDISQTPDEPPLDPF